MRVVIDDEREYCVSDNNCLKCVVLKRDNPKTLFFCVSTKSSEKLLVFIKNEKKGSKDAIIIIIIIFNFFYFYQ